MTKPLFPVDNRGLDDIADELMNAKKPEPQKAITEPKKETLEEEEARICREISERDFRLRQISAAKAQSYAPVLQGKPKLFERMKNWLSSSRNREDLYFTLFIGTFISFACFGVYRAIRESGDEPQFSRECVTIEDSMGFWGRNAYFKACSNGQMQIDAIGGDYTMINIANNENLVDKLVIDGTEYARDSAPENMFKEADATWKEYYGDLNCTDALNKWGQWLNSQDRAESIFNEVKNAQ